MSQSTWNQIRHLERCLGDSLVKLVEDGIIGERWLETLLAMKTKSQKASCGPRLKLAKEDTWNNVTMLIIEDHWDSPMCQAVWEVVRFSGYRNLKRILKNSTRPGAWACDGPWTIMVYEFLHKTAQKLHIWPCGKIQGRVYAPMAHRKPSKVLNTTIFCFLILLLPFSRPSCMKEWITHEMNTHNWWKSCLIYTKW